MYQQGVSAGGSGGVQETFVGRNQNPDVTRKAQPQVSTRNFTLLAGCCIYVLPVAVDVPLYIHNMWILTRVHGLNANISLFVHSI